MIIRQIKEKQWQQLYNHLTAYGRKNPMSLQFDIDINYNGIDYILKVQPTQNRKIAVLQAIGIYPDSTYELIDNNMLLYILIEKVLYQLTVHKN